MDVWSLVRNREYELFGEAIELTDSQWMIEYFL